MILIIIHIQFIVRDILVDHTKFNDCPSRIQLIFCGLHTFCIRAEGCLDTAIDVDSPPNVARTFYVGDGVISVLPMYPK